MSKPEANKSRKKKKVVSNVDDPPLTKNANEANSSSALSRSLYRNYYLPDNEGNQPASDNGNSAASDKGSSKLTPHNVGPGWWKEGKAYAIQVGISVRRERGRYDRFTDLGILSFETTAKGFYRVVIGYYRDIETGKEILKKIKKRGVNDAFLVHYIDGARS